LSRLFHLLRYFFISLFVSLLVALCVWLVFVALRHCGGGAMKGSSSYSSAIMATTLNTLLAHVCIEMLRSMLSSRSISTAWVVKNFAYIVTRFTWISQLLYCTLAAKHTEFIKFLYYYE
jgi:hypothetical protein